MDLHCKRCPQCISDILSLTADINSFRVKYFKPKKNPLFKKGGLSIVGILMVPLNSPGYSHRFDFCYVSLSLLFFSLLSFSHLSLSTHLSYASNLVWFVSFPRKKTTVELPQSINEHFNATIFPVACGVSAETNQDSSSRMRQKNESMLFARTLGLY